MTDHTDEIAALRARVQRLEDREEIHELIARYGRAVDDRDWDGVGGDVVEEDGEQAGALAFGHVFDVGGESLVDEQQRPTGVGVPDDDRV